MHAVSKLRASTVIFPKKQDKINYFKVHLKGTAFQIIKAYANPTSLNLFRTVKELFKTLNALFIDPNRAVKCKVYLYNPNQVIGAKNINKTFKEFYGWFLATTAIFNLSDLTLINHIKYTLNNTFKFKMGNSIDYPTFLALVA